MYLMHSCVKGTNFPITVTKIRGFTKKNTQTSWQGFIVCSALEKNDVIIKTLINTD